MLANKHQKPKEAKKEKHGINTLPIYVALIVMFALFIYFQRDSAVSAILGIALFMVIVILILIEVTNGIKEEGFKRNAIEIIAAVLIVVVFWFSLKALLHTSYPLDVVPSCSMLPQLKRGDLILLQGVNNITRISAPVIKLNASSYSNVTLDIQKEALSCVAYKQVGNRIAVSSMALPGYSIGLFSTANGGEIVPNAYQSGNPIQYTCGTATIKYDNGTTASEAYTTAVTINRTTISNDRNNSVVVYATVPGDYFYQLGDSYIVHRVYAVISSNGNYLVLTKGDNNPGLDIQYGNYPANATSIEGKVIYSIPYLGYLKLILSNSFTEPAGCNSTVVSQSA
jgi:signal peptidase I